MKKTGLKGLLACAAAIIALFAVMLPAGVLAAGTDGARSGGLITVKGADGAETYYQTLFEAADAAGDGDTLILNDNIEMAFFTLNGKRQNPTMVVEDKSLTLDGQGHTVTARNEAFSMIEVGVNGNLTVKNIVMDGSAADNRRYSSIINIEGGQVVIEEGTILKNNCTAAVDIGVNVPGGKCIMNGGMITQNVMPAGSNDTGVAVTVLEESAFIMNGGIISDNRTEKYGSSGIMVNRGGSAILNGGVIENNITQVRGMASALHIKGGHVQLNGTEIRNNISRDGYGAVYVTNHSSFGNKWDGVLDINGGVISGNKGENGNANAIYLYSRSSIKDTGAYIYFSGSPTIDGPSVIYANSSSDVNFKPLVVDGEFNPVLPVEIDLQFYYIIDQTIVEYLDGIKADSSHFTAIREDYGFQEDSLNNLLYTQAKREVIFMDGEKELEGLSYWEFVEDKIEEHQNGMAVKPGYVLKGWYTEEGLINKWDFDKDVLLREEGEFRLYAEWEALEAIPPELAPQIEVSISCGDEDGAVLHPEFDKEDGYEYTYTWQNAAGEIVGETSDLTVSSPELGGQEKYTLIVSALRTDNGRTAQASAIYIVSRGTHNFDGCIYNSEIHWQECPVCSQKQNEDKHSFEWVIDKEATASEAGLKHEECSVCGYSKEKVQIPALSDDTDNSGDSTAVGIMTLFALTGLAAVALLAAAKRRNVNVFLGKRN